MSYLKNPYVQGVLTVIGVCIIYKFAKPYLPTFITNLMPF
jgi:hypothetical protein